MREKKMSELSVEPGYLFSKKSEREWLVLKVDVSTDPVSVVDTHTILDFKCDCEGFKYSKDLSCRHTKMVFFRPTPVTRAAARAAAATVIDEWRDTFESMTFDDYVFTDAEEEWVKEVKLKAKGKPIMVGGVPHTKLTGVRHHVFFEVNIVS